VYRLIFEVCKAMASQFALCSLLSLVVHASTGSDSHDNRKWADDFGEWVPNWLKELDFAPESWSEKLGVPGWQKELQNKICYGADGARVDGANCGRGAFEREKTRLLEKLDVEQVAKLDLRTQLRTCEAKHEARYEEAVKSLQDQASLREERDSAKEELTQLQSSQQRTMACIFWLAIIVFCLLCTGGNLQHKAEARRSEVKAVNKELESLRKEFDSELGGMLTVSDYSENLGKEFSFNIADEIRDQGKVRTIKIQCPGVRQKDVFMVIVSNGCEVTIDRQASCGVDAVTWKKRFQFKASEGVFEFEEDQAVLEHGYLTLVFDVRVSQDRVFRLPPSLSDMKGADQWPEHCSDQSEQVCVVEDSAELSQDVPVEPRIATSASAIDTDEPTETCATSDAMQISTEVQIGQNPEDSQLNMLSESPEMLREAPEIEDEQDLDPSDTSSTSTLDGFEHIEHIPDMH